MLKLFLDELSSTLRSIISAAIILRTCAQFRESQSSLREDWLAVARSIPSLALYAAIFTAFGSSALLLQNTTLISDYRYSGLFLTATFLFLAAILVIALVVSVAIPLIVIERRSVLEAIRRSELMTRRRRGTIFLALALLGIILVIPQFALGMLLDQKFLSESSPALFSLLGVVKAAASILATIFAGAGIGIIYFLLSRANQSPPPISHR